MAGKLPLGVAVSPDSRTLAVGFGDRPAVELRDLMTLKLRGVADTKDLSSYISNVGWSVDGTLWAGGGVKNADGDSILRQFDAGGGKRGEDVAVANNAITGLRACSGDMAYSAADPFFGLVGVGSDVRKLATPVTLDLRGLARPGLFKASRDGGTVDFWPWGYDATPLEFDLPSARLSEAKGPLLPGETPETDGLEIDNWLNALQPTLNGKLLVIEKNQMSRSLAIRPKADGFLLGTGGSLRAFDATGGERWKTPVPGEAWGVNLARDGELIIAALGDGTIRWYRWSDGRELLALFIHKPDKRWVAWTPTGYYMASPGGEDLIGWHVNRGWDQPPDFFSADRFRDRFSRPDIVQKVLQTLDEDKAVAEANASAKIKEAAKPIEAQLPPVVTIKPPPGGDTFSGDSVTLDYSVRSPSGLKVDGIDILIDGRPLSDTKGAIRPDRALTDCTDTKPCRMAVPVPPRDIAISLQARAGNLTSEAATLRLTFAGAKPAEEIAKPKLYVLAVGVADYADPGLKLGLSGKDARDFAAAIARQKGGIYRDVEIRLLADREATRGTVMDGLDWLEKQVTSRDVGMVFLSGHGALDEKGRFYYLPSDATLDKLKGSGVPKDALMDTLRSLAGKAVLFLDACHAAQVTASATKGAGIDINAVVNEMASSENGVIVFGSSTGRELSQENESWGNSAFTKALIEGIGEGKADAGANGVITLVGLDFYIAERVKALTDGRQHPVMVKPGTIGNIPIAMSRK